MPQTVLALLLLAASLDPQTGPVISGVVRHSWSRTPLRRATVTLSTIGANPLEAVTYTDSNGAFAFGGVPPGQYTLCAQCAGYEQACYGGLTEPGRPVPRLAIRAGQNRTGIVLAARPFGSVSGSVLDSDGDPVPGAQIQMLRPVYERRSLHWQSMSEASSDDRGAYRLSFVRPGQYRFMASLPFQTVSRVQPDVSNGQLPVEEIHGISFYPHAEVIADAATLTLNAGNDIKGIDFALTAMPAAKVSGRVAVPTGIEATAAVTLIMLPDEPALQNQQVSSGAAGPDFRFQFPPALPGPHRLVAFLKTDDHTWFSTEMIDAGERSGDRIVSLTQGTPLSGRLQLEGIGAKEHGLYKVRLVPGDEVRFIGEQPVAEVKGDGTFEFDDVVPGIWDIGVEPIPPGSYIKSMMLGKKDVLTDDMILQEGTRERLNIVLSMDGAIVNGTVFENGVGDAKPAGRTMVLLAPFGKFENVLSFYQLKASDDTGRFEFKSVTPGRYKIYAFDRMEGDEYWNPDFLKPYAASGKDFEVASGARLDRATALIIRGDKGSR